jgi:SPX domain protein involved in polyphosphate accumulation
VCDILYYDDFEVEFYSERLINYEEFCAVRLKGKYSSEEI